MSRSRRDNKHSSDPKGPPTGDYPPPREWVLAAETEYRFELDGGTTLGIKVSRRYTRKTIADNSFFMQLVRGQAEVFGAELVEGKVHLFYEECKAAVYTWQGCTIEMSPQAPFNHVCRTY